MSALKHCLRDQVYLLIPLLIDEMHTSGKGSSSLMAMLVTNPCTATLALVESPGDPLLENFFNLWYNNCDPPQTDINDNEASVYSLEKQWSVCSTHDLEDLDSG